MTFYPDGRTDNATLVSTSEERETTGTDYRSAVEDWQRERDIGSIMRQRHGVCG